MRKAVAYGLPARNGIVYFKEAYASVMAVVGSLITLAGFIQIYQHNFSLDGTATYMGSICGAQGFASSASISSATWAFFQSGHCIGCPIAMIGMALLIGAYFLAD